MLGTTARDSLSSYLIKWRSRRRNGSESSGANDSRKVDMVRRRSIASSVGGRADRAWCFAGRRHDSCSLTCRASPNKGAVGIARQAERLRAAAGRVDLAEGRRGDQDIGDLDQASLGRFLSNHDSTDRCSIRIVEGKYVDEQYTGGLQQIFDLLWKTKDKDLIEHYGMWLLQRDRLLGLKVRLFTRCPPPTAD
jgi:hypothetical protein